MYSVKIMILFLKKITLSQILLGLFSDIFQLLLFSYLLLSQLWFLYLFYFVTINILSVGFCLCCVFYDTCYTKQFFVKIKIKRKETKRNVNVFVKFIKENQFLSKLHSLYLG